MLAGFVLQNNTSYDKFCTPTWRVFPEAVNAIFCILYSNFIIRSVLTISVYKTIDKAKLESRLS